MRKLSFITLTLYIFIGGSLNYTSFSYSERILEKVKINPATKPNLFYWEILPE